MTGGSPVTSLIMSTSRRASAWRLVGRTSSMKASTATSVGRVLVSVMARVCTVPATRDDTASPGAPVLSSPMPKPRMCPPELLELDLSGRTYVVTGGNSGVGLVTVAQLAKQGAHVVLACR